MWKSKRKRTRKSVYRKVLTNDAKYGIIIEEGFGTPMAMVPIKKGR